MTGYLLKVRLKRAFSSVSAMKGFNSFVYLFVISIFLVGGFLFFNRLFNFLQPIELIGIVIADKLISYSFFIFFLLLLMSNGITALSTLYDSSELNYLHSTPVHPSSIFTLKLIETIFYSSWATIIGVIPLVSAYYVSFSSFNFYIFQLAIPIISFICIPAGIGISIIVILKRINPRLSVKQLVIFLGCLSAIFILFYIKTTPYNFNVPDTLNLQAVYQFMEGLKVSNPYFPNEWFYKCTSALVTRKMPQFWKNAALLLSAGTISISLAFLLANLSYRISWLSSSSDSKPAKILKKPLLNRIPAFFNLIQKDLKIFLRSPIQWSQLLIIGVLLIVYSVSLRRTPLYVKDPFWLSAIALINTGFIGYIAATLSLRFVYPQISLEGRSWWILRSSPLSPKSILNSKAVFFLFVNLIISEIVVISSNIILVNYSLIVILSAILTAIFSTVSVFVSISFGTFFADFSETNPARIASGAGGLLTAVVTLIYIAISLLLFIVPISAYIRGQINGYPVNIKLPLIVASLIFMFITLILFYVPYILACRRINEIE